MLYVRVCWEVALFTVFDIPALAQPWYQTSNTTCSNSVDLRESKNNNHLQLHNKITNKLVGCRSGLVKSQWFDSCFGHWDPVRSGHHGLWTNALQRSLTDLDRISSFQGITQCSGLDFLCLDLNPPKLVSWFMYFYRLIDCSGKKHTKWACQGHPLTVRLINMHNSGAPVLRTLICNWKRRTLDREIFKDMFFSPNHF